jgi:hypothetical protein
VASRNIIAVFAFAADCTVIENSNMTLRPCSASLVATLLVVAGALLFAAPAAARPTAQVKTAVKRL